MRKDHTDEKTHNEQKTIDLSHLYEDDTEQRHHTDARQTQDEKIKYIYLNNNVNPSCRKYSISPPVTTGIPPPSEA